MVFRRDKSKATSTKKSAQMNFRSIKEAIRPTSARQDGPLKALDRLQLDRDVISANVNERHCSANLQLLEYFRSEKEAVFRWAARKQISSPAAAWRLYVGLAINRWIRWLERADDVGLDEVIPPLDVMMVWYSFLQHPTDWQIFAREAKVTFRGWNLEQLSESLKNSRNGQFRLAEKSHEAASNICSTLDVLELMEDAIVFLKAADPSATDLADLDDGSERILHLILRQGETISFTFQFHRSVKELLEFADRALEYSWQKMTKHDGPCRQFSSAITRYRRMMTLMQHRTFFKAKGILLPLDEFVPTLDIDLVWRTHLLSPVDYQRFSIMVRGKGLGHRPSQRFRRREIVNEAAANIYVQVFGDDFIVCHCWPCVASRGSWRDLTLLPMRWSGRPSLDRFKTKKELRIQSLTTHMSSLQLRGPQCSKCGSHPRRSCWPEDAFDNIIASSLLWSSSPQHRRTLSYGSQTVANSWTPGTQFFEIIRGRKPTAVDNRPSWERNPAPGLLIPSSQTRYRGLGTPNTRSRTRSPQGTSFQTERGCISGAENLLHPTPRTCHSRTNTQSARDGVTSWGNSTAVLPGSLSDSRRTSPNEGGDDKNISQFQRDWEALEAWFAQNENEDNPAEEYVNIEPGTWMARPKPEGN